MPVIRNFQIPLLVYEVVEYVFSLFIKIFDIVMPDVVCIGYVFFNFF